MPLPAYPGILHTPGPQRAYSDPESARDWATEISNEKLRNDSIQTGIREWTKKAPDAAREWAEANGIDLP